MGYIAWLPVRVCLAQGKTKPNVVVIYTDDHRFSGIHILANQPVKTPAIDDLAKNGIAFTNAYLMGSFDGATCIPSRAMLLTGRSLFDLGNTGKVIPTDHTTMGEAFRTPGITVISLANGTRTCPRCNDHLMPGSKIMGIGLYLVDHYRMPLNDFNHPDDLKKENAYLLQYDKQGKTIKVPYTNDLKRGPIANEFTGPHTSEIFATEAANFFKNYQKQEPFFLYLAFHAPHDPRQAPKKYKDMYPEDKMKLTPSYLPEHPFDNGDMVLRDEALAPWPRTPAVARKHLSDYYAIITHLDAQIARVIAALKASGQYENTLIILAGDSGLAVGNHGLIGKQNVYNEDGIHVPFIISGNLVKDKGRRIDALCYTHDIFPTIADLAHLPIPASVTGKSLVPVINHQARAGEGLYISRLQTVSKGIPQGRL